MQETEQMREIAESLFKKDLANIVNKVKEGKPLSAQQREYIQRFAGIDSKPPLFVKTKTELHKATGVSRPTINRLILRSDCPPMVDGKYNVDAWNKWVDEIGIKGRENVISEDATIKEIKRKREEVRLERERYEAQIKRIESQKAVGEVISRPDAERQMVFILSFVARNLELIPQRIMNSLGDHHVANEVQKIIDNTLHIMRKELSEINEDGRIDKPEIKAKPD